jgi:hypothetical protein
MDVWMGKINAIKHCVCVCVCAHTHTHTHTPLEGKINEELNEAIQYSSALLKVWNTSQSNLEVTW